MKRSHTIGRLHETVRKVAVNVEHRNYLPHGVFPEKVSGKALCCVQSRCDNSLSDTSRYLFLKMRSIHL